MAQCGMRDGLERDVDERFAREADAIEHVVDHEGGEQTGGERAGVGEGGRGGGREIIPEFAEGGGHDGELFDVAEFGGERLDFRSDGGGEFRSAGGGKMRAITEVFDRVMVARI